MNPVKGQVIFLVALLATCICLVLGMAGIDETNSPTADTTSRYQMAPIHTMVAYDLYVLDTHSGIVWLLHDGQWSRLPELPRETQP